MAIDQLNYQGINRTLTDYANARACEEMINLRPTGSGLVPVKPFHTKMFNMVYDEVLAHETSEGTNYLAIEIKQGNVENSLNVNLVNEAGDFVKTLFTLEYDANILLTKDDINIASTGNIILFSIASKDYGYYQNLAFLWNGNDYESVTADVPTIEAEVLNESALLFTDIGAILGTGDENKAANTDTISVAMNAEQEKHKEYCFGPVIIAIAFKTKDSHTFWTGQWLLYDPTPIILRDLSSTFIRTAANYQNPSAELTRFFQAYNFGYLIYAGTGATWLELAATRCALSIAPISGFDLAHSEIASVEVYASRPVPYINAAIRYGIWDNDGPNRFLIPQVPYEEMGLEKQLLYLQKSIPLEELVGASDDYIVEFEFGGSLQNTNTTLEVDAGAVSRYGRLVSYNARFHFFDSVTKTAIGEPYFESSGGTTFPSRHVFVLMNDGRKESLYYIGEKNIYEFNDLVIAPSMYIKEVLTLYQDAPYWHLKRYSMKPSQTYNFSICVSGYYDSETMRTGDSELTKYTDLIDAGPVTEFFTDEPEAMNVTEQYNPFVFNVDHSYLAHGKILDVKPQMVAVSDVEYGDYPLNIFTDRGVYALLQGSGKVLYGAMRPISNLVSVSNSISTENGTFFLAADGLWTIAGNRAVLVSDALSLGPHTELRDTAGGYSSLSRSLVGYDVSKYESLVPFEKFIEAAALSYNRHRDELILSSPNYAYSYVLSLKYRQWFKIGTSLKQRAVGSSVATVYKDIIAAGYFYNMLREFTYIELTMAYPPETYIFRYTLQEGDNIEDIRLGLQAQIDQSRIAGVRIYSISLGSNAGTINLSFPFAEEALDRLRGSVKTDYGGGDERVLRFWKRTDIVDLTDENEDGSVLVHLQTRPFSFAYQYSHIHRIVAMVRANLEDSDRLVAALYGSDDLQNWKLLTYAQREDVQLSQVRTGPAARSWRYYAVCLGGEVAPDTDFSNVLVDYTPVIRRLG